MFSTSGTQIRNKFSPEEDKKLKMLVKKHGKKNWEEISKHMNNRTGRQCRDRYCNYLAKDFTHESWKPEEDMAILKLYETYGNHWVEISKHLEGRSGNSVKNRWHKKLSKIYQAKLQSSPQEEIKENHSDPNTIQIDPNFVNTIANNVLEKQKKQSDFVSIQYFPTYIDFQPVYSILDMLD